MNDDFENVIQKILLAETSDLRELAAIAGADFRTFYRTANFRSADLSDQDLSNVDLSHASLLAASMPEDFLHKRYFQHLESDKTETISCYIYEEVHRALKENPYFGMSDLVDYIIISSSSRPSSKFEAGLSFSSLVGQVESTINLENGSAKLVRVVYKIRKETKSLIRDRSEHQGEFLYIPAVKEIYSQYLKDRFLEKTSELAEIAFRVNL